MNKKAFFSQNIVSNSISVDPIEWHPNSAAQNANFTVTISPSGSTPIISDNQTWISTSYSAPTLNIAVALYRAGTPNRTGTVTITHPDDAGLFCTVFVNQCDELQ